MKDGLNIGDNNAFIEQYVQEYSNLSLIARGDGSEVMIQNIKADIHFFIEPGEDPNLMEFFYITDGEVLLSIDGIDKKLKKGEYFYVHKLKTAVKVKSITDVTLLYVTTKPVFHYISEHIKELIEISKRSQKKDMYTHNHGDRVQTYSIEIANRLKLSDDEVERIAFASLFHDIGKINVPDEILKKPSSLTKEEFDYIKKHPEDGGKLVEKTYFKHISKVIEQHHERIDGSGYPRGLKGDDICLEARIICIADSYDAMTSDRPYRKGMTPPDALEEIKNLAGTHYDRELVDIFCEVLFEKEGIK
ncbi:HD domain-containing protein [Clostridium sp. D2Q-11]|uniref:HD domain-containing protein n=1 Tax=Anaeromonas frigoriresistens TaxID=2683708 RepID=A0A942Z794_9FIRM|nr:HD domain-containing phosphohydrolase [Anaeromonas frigoriresistens]MBS4538432.1 HD domain-containing protein [Anaeromonas frigoriresistens]